MQQIKTGLLWRRGSVALEEGVVHCSACCFRFSLAYFRILLHNVDQSYILLHNFA